MTAAILLGIWITGSLGLCWLGERWQTRRTIHRRLGIVGRRHR